MLRRGQTIEAGDRSRRTWGGGHMSEDGPAHDPAVSRIAPYGDSKPACDQPLAEVAAAWRDGRLSRREAIRRLLLGLGASSVAAIASGRPRAAGAAVPSQNFKGQTLIVTSYGGTWQQLMIDEHIPQFEAETGAKIELAIGLAKNWFAKMQAAGKDNPPYD